MLSSQLHAQWSNISKFPQNKKMYYGLMKVMSEVGIFFIFSICPFQELKYLHFQTRTNLIVEECTIYNTECYDHLLDGNYFGKDVLFGHQKTVE